MAYHPGVEPFKCVLAKTLELERQPRRHGLRHQSLTNQPARFKSYLR